MPLTPSDLPRHFAVIGSGVAGLSAAWLLSQKHRVTLIEADGRPGGHSNTIDVPGRNGLPMPVDTGFIVFNERNYPNLTAMFAHLGVQTQHAKMGFSASLDGGAFEYSSEGLKGLLGQAGNAVNLRWWAMIRDIGRFYVEAPRVVEDPKAALMTLGDYLDAKKYSDGFIRDHLLPMGAAIWSTTAEQMRDYPLVAFVRFFVHHGLLDIVDRPKWRTVTGGSRSYVERLVRDLHEVRLGAGAARVVRHAAGATVTDVNGHAQDFDGVVIATHADVALRLLGDADEQERTLLGAFDYTDNEAVLHEDARLMPRRKAVWAAWNYVGEREDRGERPLCVSYWMNALQGLDPAQDVFVTLNPTREADPAKVHRRIAYRHPLFDRKAVEAQEHLWRLRGNRNTAFAGSYFGHGFHEDALQAGLAAAEVLGGVRRPWNVADESGRIALPPELEAAE